MDENSMFTDLIVTLKERFLNNMHRHQNLSWSQVQEKIESQTDKLNSLFLMEQSGGEPDVIGYDKNANTFIFCDCSKESPKGRRSFCYDRRALEARKQHKPISNALDAALEMGVQLLDEGQYRSLLKIEAFDTKTSSWISTPAKIRSLGGALFGDFRYDTVFIYHNGASSYYASRGFRAFLRV